MAASRLLQTAHPNAACLRYDVENVDKVLLTWTRIIVKPQHVQLAPRLHLKHDMCRHQLGEYAQGSTLADHEKGLLLIGFDSVIGKKASIM